MTSNTTTTARSKHNAALYLVATPIGNLDELTPRAKLVLMQVDLILCEDTRHSGKLLKHFAISTPCISLHKFNEQQKVESIIQKLHNNQHIALISDAGAPAIADPGTRLVNACHNYGIAVIPISGASAIINAAMVSGLVDDGYVFGGFMPPKDQLAMRWMRQLLRTEFAVVVFVSPRRVGAFLQLLHDIVGGNHRLWIGREMTKHYEELTCSSIAQHMAHFLQDTHTPRGEFTVVIDKLSPNEIAQDDLHQLAAMFVEKDVPPAKASAIMAKVSGASRQACYKAYQHCKEHL